MKYLLAVDGGGTKTEFCLSDQKGQILGSVTTESSSIKSVGFDYSLEQLRKGIELITQQFQITIEDIEQGVFGMSGYDSEQDKKLILDQILQLGFRQEQIYICNDGVLAFYAQTSEPGIVVISGTGSVVLGIDQTGTVRRSGGWGYHFSDIGSGYWIGAEILKETLLYCDHCRDYNPLFKKVSDHFEVESYEMLPYKITDIKNTSQIAALALDVVQAAAGNELAKDIVTRGMNHLACQVFGIYQQMGLAEQELQIVFSGGVLTNELCQQILSDALESKIGRGKIRLFTQKNRPAIGGIKRAGYFVNKN